MSPSKKKVVRVQRVTSFGRVYGEKLEMSEQWYWYNAYDTLSPTETRTSTVLNETIPTSGA